MLTTKMRNALMATLFCLVCSVASKAQTPTTNLHVVLSALLSIQVNDADVSLTYTTLADYQAGVTTTKTGHLTVSSLLPYTIKLKVNTATLPGTATPANTVDPSIVQVLLPTGGNNTGFGSATVTTIASLSTTAAALITSAPPALAKLLDVQYSISASNTLTGILGKPADDYKSTITYTITN